MRIAQRFNAGPHAWHSLWNHSGGGGTRRFTLHELRFTSYASGGVKTVKPIPEHVPRI